MEANARRIKEERVQSHTNLRKEAIIWINNSPSALILHWPWVVQVTLKDQESCHILSGPFPSIEFLTNRPIR